VLLIPSSTRAVFNGVSSGRTRTLSMTWLKAISASALVKVMVENLMDLLEMMEMMMEVEMDDGGGDGDGDGVG
jgi:hypothetical protein